MDTRAEVRGFLTSRRARLSPEQVGLTLDAARRRVPGLRREEVAHLAGVSVDYYKRLENGNLRGASESVLEAISRALHLGETERAHLLDLARAAQASRRVDDCGAMSVRPSVQHLLDSMTNSPAFVRNGRLDVVAVNAAGQALYCSAFEHQRGPVNLMRFLFLDPAARLLYVDWHASADDTVALLRVEAARNPHDRGLTSLVDELATRSQEFRVRWDAHEVCMRHHGTRHFDHPVVGDIELEFDTFELQSDHRLTLNAYTAAPRTPSAHKLARLMTWHAATTARPDPSNVRLTDRSCGSALAGAGWHRSADLG